MHRIYECHRTGRTARTQIGNLQTKIQGLNWTLNICPMIKKTNQFKTVLVLIDLIFKMNYMQLLST